MEIETDIDNTSSSYEEVYESESSFSPDSEEEHNFRLGTRLDTKSRAILCFVLKNKKKRKLFSSHMIKDLCSVHGFKHYGPHGKITIEYEDTEMKKRKRLRPWETYYPPIFGRGIRTVCTFTNMKTGTSFKHDLGDGYMNCHEWIYDRFLFWKVTNHENTTYNVIFDFKYFFECENLKKKWNIDEFECDFSNRSCHPILKHRDPEITYIPFIYSSIDCEDSGLYISYDFETNQVVKHENQYQYTGDNPNIDKTAKFSFHDAYELSEYSSTDFHTLFIEYEDVRVPILNLSDIMKKD